MIDPAEKCFVEHVEQLFPREAIIEVRQYLEEIWETIDPNALPAREQMIYRLGAAPDQVRFDHTWYNLWKSVSAAKLASFRPFTRLTFPLQIRHIVQTDQLVPWHQDIGYQALRGENAHEHLITCFLPIEPEPSTVPTLEFAVGLFPTLRHHPSGDHGAALTFENVPPTTRFDLNCGDALVFGDHTPHQTYVPENLSRSDRWSFEYRLVRPEDCKVGRDYFDIENGCFLKT